MKDKIYNVLPVFFQELLISLFNYLAYKKRYGNNYEMYLDRFKKNRQLNKQELIGNQKVRFESFLKNSIKNASYYSGYPDIAIEDISVLPIVKKEDIRSHIDNIYTITKKEGIVSKTGGTTGKSLEVLFTKDNMQERFAMLDDFRGRFGYKLGKRTAWFSGKNILTKRDVKNKRFWKTDNFHKVRYYSTFHIKEDYLEFYIMNLIVYKPEYFVGFPSTMLDIARYGLKKGVDFPEGTIKAIFPTAETVNPEMRRLIELFFKTKMYDQYASSEGAPFIFECKKGNLHLELQSGVFEVLDNNDQYAQSGRLVVTSFTTEGTPLIRYDIGDSIELSDEVCSCSNNNPMVKQIFGRSDDYIYSPENGKINLGNVSNTLKDTRGIVKFQAIQDELDRVVIKIEVDSKKYTKNIEKVFLKNWRDRIGGTMKIQLDYVDEIPVEKSGKFRFVKNNIKHLI